MAGIFLDRYVGMRGTIKTILFLIFSCCVLLPGSLCQSVISVLYFDNTRQDERYDWLRKGIADILITELKAVETVRVVERNDLEKLIREQELALSDLTDDTQSVRIGSLLQADTLIYGGFIVDRDTIRVDGRVTDTESGDIRKTFKAVGLLEHMLDWQEALADGLFRALGLGRPKENLYRTASLRAMESYYIGLNLLDLGQTDKAIEKFNESSRYDALYAKPQMSLEEAYLFIKDFRSIQKLKERAAYNKELAIMLGSFDAEFKRLMALEPQGLSRGETLSVMDELYDLSGKCRQITTKLGKPPFEGSERQPYIELQARYIGYKVLLFEKMIYLGEHERSASGSGKEYLDLLKKINLALEQYHDHRVNRENTVYHRYDPYYYRGYQKELYEEIMSKFPDEIGAFIDEYERTLDIIGNGECYLDEKGNPLSIHRSAPRMKWILGMFNGDNYRHEGGTRGAVVTDQGEVVFGDRDCALSIDRETGFVKYRWADEGASKRRVFDYGNPPLYSPSDGGVVALSEQNSLFRIIGSDGIKRYDFELEDHFDEIEPSYVSWNKKISDASPQLFEMGYPELSLGGSMHFGFEFSPSAPEPVRDQKQYNVGAVDRNGNTITLEYEIEFLDDGKRTAGPAWTYFLEKRSPTGKLVLKKDLVKVKSTQYWPWHNPFLYNQLILDSRGSIIVVGMGGSDESPNVHIYKASSEGALQWEAKLPMVRAADSKSQRGHPFTLPVADTTDSIYMGAGNHIYCVSAQGEILWKKNLASRITASPLLGNAKVLYVATEDRTLYALSLDGKVLWKIRILYHRPSELVMDNRGVLYFPLYRGLRAALQTESTGPMDSAWPMFMHDQYNSGNAAFRISDLP